MRIFNVLNERPDRRLLLLLLVLGSSCHSSTSTSSSSAQPSSSAPSPSTPSSPSATPSNSSATSSSNSPSTTPTPGGPAPNQQPRSGGDSGRKTIVFFGNSITAGYGLDPDEAFPALIRRRIDSLRLPYDVIAAGVSGETSAGGKSRIGWILRQRVDVFVLELGGNDGLRGIPVSSTLENLQAIFDSVKSKYPSAKLVLAGMQMPPSMGSKYTADFKAVFTQLANRNKLAFIPFILEGVGGVPALNQADGIHPTAEGQQIVAENVWEVLKKVLL